MNRRGFLGAILAAGVSPAVVRAASLMPVRVLDSGIVTLTTDGYVPFVWDCNPVPTLGWHIYRRLGENTRDTLERIAYETLTAIR